MGLEERQQLAVSVALRLLNLTYTELGRLSYDKDGPDAFLAELGIDIHELPYVSLMIGHLGTFWKRVCVEITVVGNPDSNEQPGCVYFEKFRNGKLVVYGFRTE